jgi:hypothetical protein
MLLRQAVRVPDGRVLPRLSGAAAAARLLGGSVSVPPPGPPADSRGPPRVSALYHADFSCLPNTSSASQAVPVPPRSHRAREDLIVRSYSETSIRALFVRRSTVRVPLGLYARSNRDSAASCASQLRVASSAVYPRRWMSLAMRSARCVSREAPTQMESETRSRTSGWVLIRPSTNTQSPGTQQLASSSTTPDLWSYRGTRAPLPEARHSIALRSASMSYAPSSNPVSPCRDRSSRPSLSQLSVST